MVNDVGHAGDVLGKGRGGCGAPHWGRGVLVPNQTTCQGTSGWRIVQWTVVAHQRALGHALVHVGTRLENAARALLRKTLGTLQATQCPSNRHGGGHRSGVAG